MMRLITVRMLILLWVCYSYTQAQEEECAYLPSFSPVWDSAQDIIAVVGCSGIQFYDNTLHPIIDIEISGMRKLVISPNGKWMASASTEQTVFIDLEKLEVVFAIDDGDLDMTWHPSKSWLVRYADEDETLQVIDADRQEMIYEQAIDHPALNLSWGNDDYIRYVGLAHSELHQWQPGEISEFIQEFPISIQYGMFQANTWSPDGTKFAFMFMPLREYSGRNPLGIWNIEDKVYISPEHSDLNYSILMGIAWHPSGEFVAISTYESVYIWDASTLDLLATFPINEIEPSYEMTLNECRGLAGADINQYITWNSEGTQILVTSLCRLAIFSVLDL